MPSCNIFGGPCPDDLHGIRSKERIDSLITAQSTSTSQASCGALGDIEVGSTINWTARVHSPGDGCPDAVNMTDVSVANLTVEPTTSNFIPVELANGCRGTWAPGLSYTHLNASDAGT
jgi:hypothetical protein